MTAPMTKQESIDRAAALRGQRDADDPMPKDEREAVATVTAILRAELKANARNIPDGLKALKGWLVWRMPEVSATRKLGKRPYYPNGKPRQGQQGSAQDLASLGTWAEAMAAMNRDKTLSGVGLAMLPQWGLVALDADHCIEAGAISPDVARAADCTYGEISPSGTGIRAFWRGECTNGRSAETGIELYSQKQFVTVTGAVLSNTWTGVRGSTAADPLPSLDADLRAKLEMLAGSRGKVAVNETPGLPKAERRSDAAVSDPKLKAIIDAGLYERQIGPGKHSIRCPFEHLHSDHGRAPGDGDTIYFEPNYGGHAEGAIHCSHSHGNEQREFWQAIGYDEIIGMFDVLPPEAVATEPANGLDDNLIPLQTDIFDADDVLPHVVAHWLPCDEVTLLAGHGGGGKSFVALSLAVHVALGLPFGNLPTTQSNVLFFSAEDGARVLRQRLARICRALSLDVADLVGKLHLLDASDLDPALYREQRGFGAKQSTDTAMLGALADVVARIDAGLVIVDNASDAFDGDEIKRASVRGFVRALRTRLARPGRAVLLLCHVNKSSAAGGRGASAEDYSGSTAWHNSVRSRLSLTPDGDTAMLIVHAKANLSGKADPVRLEWHDGVPLVAGSSARLAEAHEAKRLADMERDREDKGALVEIIKNFDRRGERITTSLHGGLTTYKALSHHPLFPPGTNSDRLTRLIRDMESEGAIFRRTIRTPDRKLREVFTCAESAPNAEAAP